MQFQSFGCGCSLPRGWALPHPGARSYIRAYRYRRRLGDAPGIRRLRPASATYAAPGKPLIWAGHFVPG